MFRIKSYAKNAQLDPPLKANEKDRFLSKKSNEKIPGGNQMEHSRTSLLQLDQTSKNGGDLNLEKVGGKRKLEESEDQSRMKRRKTNEEKVLEDQERENAEHEEVEKSCTSKKRVESTKSDIC